MTFVFRYIICVWPGTDLDLRQWFEQKLVFNEKIDTCNRILYKQTRQTDPLFIFNEASSLGLRCGLDLHNFTRWLIPFLNFFHWIHINSFQFQKGIFMIKISEDYITETWMYIFWNESIKPGSLKREIYSKNFLAISPSVNCHTRSVENTLGQSPKNFNKTHVEINFRPSFQYTLTCCLIPVKEKTQTIP